MDLAAAALLLVAFSPLMAFLGLIVRLSSSGPALFRQPRAGRYGREFLLLKFRTMLHTDSAGPGVTQKDDYRITRIGRFLRATKMDELPQLINVLRGEMSLVGPRPDLSCFWDKATANDRMVLGLTPGLTGAASLIFRSEEELLSQVPESQLVDFYTNTVLRRKAKLDLAYAAGATFFSDCRIMIQTVYQIVRPTLKSQAQRLQHELIPR